MADRPESGLQPREQRRWRRYTALVAAVLFVGLLGYGLSRGVDDRVDSALQEGRATEAPGFELDVLTEGEAPQGRLRRSLEAAAEDGAVELGELDGLPIVLNFWASWCGPCREEAPTLERGWRRAQERGVLYVGLDMQDLSDDALEFVDEFSITYPMIRDPGRDVSLQYGLTGIPETFFIDRDGEVVGHAIGVVTDEILAEGEKAARTGSVVGVIRAGAQGARR